MSSIRASERCPGARFIFLLPLILLMGARPVSGGDVWVEASNVGQGVVLGLESSQDVSCLVMVPKHVLGEGDEEAKVYGEWSGARLARLRGLGHLVAVFAVKDPDDRCQRLSRLSSGQQVERELRTQASAVLQSRERDGAHVSIPVSIVRWNQQEIQVRPVPGFGSRMGQGRSGSALVVSGNLFAGVLTEVRDAGDGLEEGIVISRQSLIRDLEIALPELQTASPSLIPCDELEDDLSNVEYQEARIEVDIVSGQLTLELLTVWPTLRGDTPTKNARILVRDYTQGFKKTNIFELAEGDVHRYRWDRHLFQIHANDLAEGRGRLIVCEER